MKLAVIHKVLESATFRKSSADSMGYDDVLQQSQHRVSSNEQSSVMNMRLHEKDVGRRGQWHGILES